MDVSSLTDDQVKIAVKVIAAAKKHGVNPDFALAVAFAESGFDPNAKSPRGALGPMQLLPNTAKGLGVDPTNVDENIEGGVRHLKAISGNQKIGNDPLRVLAAYNAGETRAGEFLDKDDLDLMPEETVGYIAKIANLSGGELPSVMASQEEQEPPDQSNQFGTSGQALDEQAAEVKGAFEKTPANRRREAQILGGAAGLGVGGAKYLTFNAPYQMFMAAKNFLGRNPVSLEEATKVLNAAYGSQTENAVLDATQAVSGKPTGVNAYIPSQTRSKANAEQLAAVANVPPIETNAEAQQAIKRIGAEGHPSDRIPIKKTVIRNGVPVEITIGYRSPTPSLGAELQNLVNPVDEVISAPRPSNVAPITMERLRGHNLGPPPYVAFRGQQSPFGIWEDSNPRDTGAVRSALGNAGRSTVNAARNVGTAVASAAPVIGRGVTSVLGSVPFRLGAAGASTLGNYSDYQSAKEKGDTTGQAVAATGGLGALASLVPKISPVGGLMAGGADAFRRAREGDYTGAAISGGATLAPWAARAAFGSALGPAGSVAAMSAPIVYDAIKYKAWQDAQRLAEAMETEEGRENYWLTRGAFD
jgi:hypothetical protein